LVDEAQCCLGTLSSHTLCLSQLSLESKNRIDAMQVKEEAKPNSNVNMRESLVKQSYTCYSDQNKVRL
ncbi:hypothetical protein BD560DRAFT_314117, partial [Blakeslea trispora]